MSLHLVNGARRTVSNRRLPKAVTLLRIAIPDQVNNSKQFDRTFVAEHCGTGPLEVGASLNCPPAHITARSLGSIWLASIALAH